MDRHPWPKRLISFSFSSSSSSSVFRSEFEDEDEEEEPLAIDEMLERIKEFCSREKAQEAHKNRTVLRLLRFFAATALLNSL
jgi:hypothetical protein